jgi:hypothetical protein
MQNEFMLTVKIQFNVFWSVKSVLTLLSFITAYLFNRVNSIMRRVKQWSSLLLH